MSTISLNTSMIPNEREAKLAKQSSKILSAYAPFSNTSDIQILVGGAPKGKMVSIPTSAFRLLLNVLTEMSEGNAVTLIPIHAELTSQEAADLLNVSRPYMVKLLEEGQIPCRKVGARRRVLLQDLMNYKEREDAKRLKVLEELTKHSQDLDLY